MTIADDDPPTGSTPTPGNPNPGTSGGGKSGGGGGSLHWLFLLIGTVLATMRRQVTLAAT